MGGNRCAWLGRMLMPIALFGAAPVLAQDQPAPPAAATPAPAIIVLDGSRSMWAKLGGQSKVALVRSGLDQAFSDYQNRIAFGLVAFGHRDAAPCTESQLLAKPGELTAATRGKLQFGAGFKPKLSKPIAAALGEAVKGAPSPSGSLDVVLITDGLDSCKADVCATAKTLKQSMPGLRIHVIGFDPKAKQSLKALKCVADTTGGLFVPATNVAELKQSLTAAFDAAAPAAPAPAAPVAAAAPPAPPPVPTVAVAPPPAPAAPVTTTPPPGPTPVATVAIAPPPLPAAPVTAAPPPAAVSPAPAATAPVVAALPAPSALSPTATPPAPPPAPGAAAAPAVAVAPPPAAAAPAPAAPRQSAQTKADPPQGAAAAPQAPGQTSMAKSAALSPAQVAAPAVAGPGAPPRPAPNTLTGPSLPVPVTFKALLTEAGPKVQSGLIWRVFTAEAGPNGTRKLVSTHREAIPTAALLPGEYLVNAAYGLSNLTKKIKVESGRSIEETFVLNTGGLKLAAVQANGEPLPQTTVHFDILSDEEDQFGNRHKILGDAKPGVVIRLNAGAYHIVSTYGDANATVRADVTVEPGKITEATVKHAAAPVTFKLVQTSGGEALADTKWSILTTTGDVVKEVAGALPTHILAAGDYAAVANHNGESYMTKFKVTAGEAKQIEVVMERGPTSPEALKAVTNPPPPPEPAATDATTTAGSGVPASSDTGLGFGGGGGEPATPREPGLFPNPGALLRPRLP